MNLDKSAGGPEYAKVVDQLEADDKARTDFLKACLAKLGLRVNQETATVPSLSCLHLSSVDSEDTGRLVSSLEEIISKEGDKEYLKDDNDTFLIERPDAFRMEELEEALSSVNDPAEETKADQSSSTTEDRIVDYNSIVKRLLIHKELPSSKITPYWNHHAFYTHLRTYQSQSKEAILDFGRHLLYGEVVTSTNTILEKYVIPILFPCRSSSLMDESRNTQLLRRLPTGFTATATVQVAGRGRGSNVWVSPAGALMFSTVIRHPVDKIQSAPVVFIQYLAAMAVVKGIKSYDKGYEDLPVKLKWPNDVCEYMTVIRYKQTD